MSGDDAETVSVVPTRHEVEEIAIGREEAIRLIATTLCGTPCCIGHPTMITCIGEAEQLSEAQRVLEAMEERGLIRTKVWGKIT